MSFSPGWICTGGDTNTASTCNLDAGCGNGMIAGIEECDDGNLDPFDGCSNVCIIELNSFCVG